MDGTSFDDSATYACAFCGEPNEIDVDFSAGSRQSYVAGAEEPGTSVRSSVRCGWSFPRGDPRRPPLPGAGAEGPGTSVRSAGPGPRREGGA
ncbi:MAG: CPXCG motif-containing cysteine-rich protein [bacterium]|nr:CPXCG motif-containing cysteine-rich protein [bacterium]